MKHFGLFSPRKRHERNKASKKPQSGEKHTQEAKCLSAKNIDLFSGAILDINSHEILGQNIKTIQS